MLGAFRFDQTRITSSSSRSQHFLDAVVITPHFLPSFKHFRCLFRATGENQGMEPIEFVKLVQRRLGVADDGKPGPLTIAALDKALPGKSPPAEKLTATIVDHRWATAIREDVPGGLTMPVIRFLVVHFTNGATALSSINFWRSPEAKGACAHIVIDRDGTIYQCRPFNVSCGHAGVSEWKGTSGLNSCSIGIELANAGDDVPLAKRWTKLPLVTAKHKNGGPFKEWEAYPQAQVDALTTVAKMLVCRYGLEDLVGHDDIAPARKVDPGPALDMKALRAACGFT